MFKPNLLFPGIPIHLIRSVRPILAAQALSCAVFVLLVLLAGPSYAADTDGPATLPASLFPGLPAWSPQLLGAQATFIYQNMPAFHSPYIGQDSLRFDHGLGQEMSQTYGVYLGSQVTRYFQTYLDVEMFQGNGLSRGVGLGGYTNGDVLRSGSADLGKAPYLARLFGRYLIPLSGEMGEPVERGMDQLPGKEPADRIEIKGGKLSPADDFDLNRYANNQRTQFLNDAFLYNLAWDYAADTRGYTIGGSIALVHPSWRLILGSYQMPTTANGNVLDDQIYHAREDNLELTLKPPSTGTVIRLLAFRNEAQMGDFRDAMALGAATGTTPDVAADTRPGHTQIRLRHQPGATPGGRRGDRPLRESGLGQRHERNVVLRGGRSPCERGDPGERVSLVASRRPIRHGNRGRRSFRLSPALPRRGGHRHGDRRRGPQLWPGADIRGLLPHPARPLRPAQPGLPAHRESRVQPRQGTGRRVRCSAPAELLNMAGAGTRRKAASWTWPFTNCVMGIENRRK